MGLNPAETPKFFFFFLGGGGGGGGGGCIVSTTNPLLSPPPPPPGGYLFQTHLRGTLIETWDLFNLAQPIVSVKELLVECRAEKLKYKKFEVMQARIKSQSKLPAGEV